MSFRYHFTKQIIHPVFLDVAYARHKIMEQRRIFPQEGKKGLLLSFISWQLWDIILLLSGLAKCYADGRRRGEGRFFSCFHYYYGGEIHVWLLTVVQVKCFYFFSQNERSHAWWQTKTFFFLLRSIPLRLSCLPICNCRSFDDEKEEEWLSFPAFLMWS